MAQESAAISITIGSKNDTSSGEYINAHTKSEMKDNAILKKPSSLFPLLLLRLTQAAPRALGFRDKGTGFRTTEEGGTCPKRTKHYVRGLLPCQSGNSCIRKNRLRRAG
jgi:hypothetical protein